VAVADGAVLAFLARGPWWATALVLPAAAELLRTAARRTGMRIITPVGVTLLLGLEFRPFSERLEVLHVGHASDPLGAMTLFLLTVVLSVAVWRRGQLPLAMGFLAAHLGGQALRLLAGRTSFEAVEIPAASLGLLLLAAVVLADPNLRAPWPLLAAIGVAAGTLDVILRDRGVAYAPVVAIVGVTILVGAWHAAFGPPGWREGTETEVSSGSDDDRSDRAQTGGQPKRAK